MKFKHSVNYLKIFEIIIIISFLLVGFLLYWQERVNHNLDYQKSWVNFYFKNPHNPAEGVELNNHLGYTGAFELCLVPDNNSLMEPKDLSCNSVTAVNKERHNVDAAKNLSWQWPTLTQAGKHWVVLQYITKDGQENKRSLSFTN